jgi:Uma2 family endonuclease
MPTPEPIYYTADMVRTLNADEPRSIKYETVYGELFVSPAPRPWHQVIVGRLIVALTNHVERVDAPCQVFGSLSGISWGRPDVLVQPDVFVVPTGEAQALTWNHMRTLLLAIEVLSPSSVRADRFTKRRLYQSQGVPLYWVVDADERTVDVWTPGDDFPHVEREQLVWAPTGAAPCLLPLGALFRPL